MTSVAVLLLSALAAAPASARVAAGGESAFAVANGAAVFSVTTDASSTSGRIVARRLGLDGGLVWEDRYGSGRNEEAVSAAVTRYGGLTVVGNNDSGCWLAHWSSKGVLDWNAVLTYGSACQVRTVLVDSAGNTYVLGTTTLGDQFDATLWKYDHLGSQKWVNRPSGFVSHYAFGLTLSAAEDAVTVTNAVSGPTGWAYDTYDVTSSGDRK